MSVESILPIMVMRNTAIQQKIRTEVKQEAVKREQFTIPDIALSLSPILFAGSWLIFFLVLRKVRTFIDNKMVFTVSSEHKVPCKNCQYFTNNHYLKCAVNPCVVMTEAAQNCSEYRPKKSIFSPKQLLGRNDNS